jgi:hypothetical protein
VFILRGISLNKNKRIFYTAAESIVTCVCETWAVGYRFKTKLLSAGTDIWKRAARAPIIKSKILSKSKNGSDSVLKRMENNGLKWRRHITHGR